MSALGEHLALFKADWIGDPDLLAQRIRTAEVADRYTAELAQDIQRLMERFGSRFARLGELMQPRLYEPKKPVRELPLATYVVPVPLLLDHGHSGNNEVKLEFHFEQQLPAFELITGALGPAATPEITAALPELPYQIAIKLMILAAAPVGIEEATRAAAVPRQMYDIDLLLATLAADRWQPLSDYCRQRYSEECRRCQVEVRPGEPFDGVRARLERWANCLDETSSPNSYRREGRERFERRWQSSPESRPESSRSSFATSCGARWMPGTTATCARISPVRANCCISPRGSRGDDLCMWDGASRLPWRRKSSRSTSR